MKAYVGLVPSFRWWSSVCLCLHSELLLSFHAIVCSSDWKIRSLPHAGKINLIFLAVWTQNPSCPASKCIQPWAGGGRIISILFAHLLLRSVSFFHFHNRANSTSHMESDLFSSDLGHFHMCYWIRDLRLNSPIVIHSRSTFITML